MNAKSMICLGLDSVKHLLCSFNHPERDFNIIHVAGTNGKGSTATLLASCLADCTCPFSTNPKSYGLFLSPYLIEPRDAWQIRLPNDKIIIASEDEYTKITAQLSLDCPLATVFEVDFVGFLIWLRIKDVNSAVIEVGLGGALDATNVFQGYICSSCTNQQPNVQSKICVITSIGIDHVPLLGPKLSDIALAKAGIMVKNVPAIYDATSGKKVTQTLIDYAKSINLQDITGVKSVLSNDNIEIWTQEKSQEAVCEFSIYSCKAREFCLTPNVAVVFVVLWRLLKTFKIDVSAAYLVDIIIEKSRVGFPTIETNSCVLPAPLPGRRSFLSIELDNNKIIPVWLDGSHNPQSCEILRTCLMDKNNLYLMVLAMSGGRCPKEYIDIFKGDWLDSKNLKIIAVEFSKPQTMSWINPLSEIDFKKILFNENLILTANRIWDQSVQNELEKHCSSHQIIIAGSLYLVADVYRWISNCFERKNGRRLPLEEIFKAHK